MATLSGHLLENSKNLWVTLHLGNSQSSYGEKTTLEAAAFPWLRTKRPTPCDALRTLLAEDATNLNMAAEMRTIFSEFGLFPPRENTPTSSNPYTHQPKHTVLREQLVRFANCKPISIHLLQQITSLSKAKFRNQLVVMYRSILLIFLKVACFCFVE